MKTTKNAPFEARKQAWQAAIDAADTHVKLGQHLQRHGASVLQSAETTADPAKTVTQATTIIDKGVKIERDARDKLIDLYTQEPRP